MKIMIVKMTVVRVMTIIMTIKIMITGMKKKKSY